MNMVTGDDLQRAAATGWGFSEREYLGAWELRASGGFTSRANAAWPLGDAGLPLSEAVRTVKAWYAARGLPARIVTIAGSDFDATIEGCGFPVAESAALRQTADVDSALRTLRASADSSRTAELTADLPGDFFSIYKRGQGHPHSAAVLSGGDAEVCFATVRDADGTALAIGRLGLAPDAGCAGLAAVYTDEHARRRGLSHVVLRDLLQYAADGGAHTAFLEVEPDNVPAIALYAKLGFTTDHRYHYRSAA
jgi:GNAT superfamily N-acetyltransferase